MNKHITQILKNIHITKGSTRTPQIKTTTKTNGGKCGWVLFKKSFHAHNKTHRVANGQITIKS